MRTLRHLSHRLLHLRLLPHFLVLVLPLTLAACASQGSAAWQTLQQAWASNDAVAGAPINPPLKYLRVVIDGRSVLLALGYADPHPLGPIEVWYSAEREALRLQNGRLVGVAGATAEWRGVTVPALPAWSAIARSASPTRWQRSRDVMPGYRYGVRDALLTYHIQPPAKSRLVGVDPASLLWFEERQEAPAGRGAQWVATSAMPDELPPARYAVSTINGMESVVYAEQCAAADLCFTWQRWPPASVNAGR